MLLALLIAVTTYLISQWLPWWTLILPCLVFGSMLGKSEKSSFLYGFLGIGGLWLIQTTYIHWANEGILTSRIAELFHLPHPLLAILAAALIGGLLGGFSTLTGYLFDQTFLFRNGKHQ